MRKIKFRAWNGKSMTDSQLLSITMNGTLEGCGGDVGVKILDYPLMQYTGLKDKNGKEIFEGDVIDKKYKWEVVFENGAFFACRKGLNTELVSRVLLKRECALTPVEIIGNIYENPELTKVTQ